MESLPLPRVLFGVDWSTGSPAPFVSDMSSGDAQIIKERNEATRKLAEDIDNLNDVAKDLADLAKDGDEDLNKIEETTTVSSGNTTQAATDAKDANKLHSHCCCPKCCCCTIS